MSAMKCGEAVADEQLHHQSAQYEPQPHFDLLDVNRSSP